MSVIFSHQRTISRKVARGLFFFLLTLQACSQQKPYQPGFGTQDKKKQELLFGLPSLSFSETSQALVSYLNGHLGPLKVRVAACVSMEDYEEQVRKRNFDFIVINGPQLELATRSGYRVVGRIGDEYQSVIFINKDSAVQNLNDLRGRTISLTGRNVLAGAIMPLMYLYHHGVDVNNAVKRRYTPSYESVLMDVCLGKSSVGAVWGTAYRNFLRLKPALGAHLEIKWVTPGLAGSALLLRQEMDSSVASRLTDLFFHLQNDLAGRAALAQLGISQFVATDSSCYDPMKSLIREYNSLIR
jgi:ABC-type phosphate/phosphonate transport system substrate-binding protein